MLSSVTRILRSEANLGWQVTTDAEAAKIAPRRHPADALLYDQEKQKNNRNRALRSSARDGAK